MDGGRGGGRARATDEISSNPLSECPGSESAPQSRARQQQRAREPIGRTSASAGGRPAARWCERQITRIFVARSPSDKTPDTADDSTQDMAELCIATEYRLPRPAYLAPPRRCLRKASLVGLRPRNATSESISSLPCTAQPRQPNGWKRPRGKRQAERWRTSLRQPRGSPCGTAAPRRGSSGPGQTRSRTCRR